MKKIIFSFILIISFYPCDSQTMSQDTSNYPPIIDSLLSKDSETSRVLFFESNREAIEEYSDIPFVKCLIKNMLGQQFLRDRAYDQALSSFQEAMLIAESINDIGSIVVLINNIAIIYWKTGEYKKGIQFNEKGLQKIKELKLIGNETRFLDNKTRFLIGLGIIYAEMRELKKALNYFMQAKKLSETYDVYEEIIEHINRNIAVTHTLMGNSTEALPIFKEILDLHKTLKDSIRFGGDYGNIAYAWQNMGNFEKALIYYDSSLYYSKLFNQDDITYVTLLDKSDGYALNKDYKNALITYQTYHETFQNIINAKTKERIRELEVEFDVERKERDLKASQQEVFLLEQEGQIRNQRMLLILGGLIASFIIVFLIYFKWKSDLANNEIQEKLMQIELKNSKLKEQRLNKQIEFKNKDLTNLSLEINRKNDFSDNLIQKIENLKKIPPHKIKESLKDLILFVTNNLKLNQDLEILQRNIQEVNQQFFEELVKEFPDLNPNERNLCGLIRLNFSNKEIALIKNVSVSSAKMSRYRIRKKLHLNPKEDIVTFLQTI